MNAPSITLAALRALKPCKDAMTRLSGLPSDQPVTAAIACQHGATFSDVIWVASELAYRNTDVERRLRLWAADCAARVVHLCGDDPRPAASIVAARQFARGEITAAKTEAARATSRVAAWENEIDATRVAAWDAASDANAAEEAWATARAAINAEEASATARYAARATTWAAVSVITSDVAWVAAWHAAWTAEEAWQFDRLIARMSDVEPDDWPINVENAK